LKCGYGKEWKRSASLINEKVIKGGNKDKQILNSIFESKHQWIGHVLKQTDFARNY